MNEEMRKEFEEWWRGTMNTDAMPMDRTNYPMTKPENQQYMSHETNRSWLAWQASREAMKPIRFPGEIDIDLIGDQVANSHANSYAEGYNDALSDLELKITELGYKVE